MTKGKNGMNFIVIYTSSNNLITAKSPQVWLIP